MKKRQMLIWGLMFISMLAFTQNQRNVLIYNLTSTDCGPCSCMDSIYKNNVLPAFPKTIVVAFHGIGSYFKNWQGDSVFNYFRQIYDPSGFIDGLGYDVYYRYFTDSVANRYANHSHTPVAIEIDSLNWDEVTRVVNLSVTIRNDGPQLPGAYWYNVIVTEDNIKHTHRTMDSCSTPDVQGLPFRNEYFNFWVTRKMVFWSQGDSLIGPSWPGQQSINRSCSFSIDTAWVVENCYVVINVYKKADSIYQSPVQQVIKQSIKGGIGIDDVKPLKDEIINIFPNPARDIINIHLSLAGDEVCSLRIFDMNGKEMDNIINGMVKSGIYNAEIITHYYPVGTYIAVLTTNRGKVMKRFVIL